jgi:hypothetical protein
MQHHVSILSRRAEYKLEYFCSDCYDGAGRREIVKFKGAREQP